MTITSSASGFTGVPIVFGVTGHRDTRAVDRTQLTKALVDIFQDFRQKFPASPFKLLTMLAPGADQIASEAFELEKRAHPDLTYELVIALPCPSDIYEKSSSFADNPEDPDKWRDARTAYRAWIDDPQNTHFVVPFPGSPASTDSARWEKVMDNSELRHRCYCNAGVYIADHCHVFIALWDGKEIGQTGGTREMLNYKLTGLPPKDFTEFRPLNLGSEPGPVLTVFTPRSSSNDNDGHQPLESNPGLCHVRFDYSEEKEEPKANDNLIERPKKKRWKPKASRSISFFWSKSHKKLKDDKNRLFEVFERFRHALGLAWKPGHEPYLVKWSENFWKYFGIGEKSNPELEAAQAQWHRLQETCQAVEDFNRSAQRLLSGRLACSYQGRLDSPWNKKLRSWADPQSGRLPEVLERIVEVREMAAIRSQGLEAVATRVLRTLYGVVVLAVAFNFSLLHFPNTSLRDWGFSGYMLCFAAMIGMVACAWYYRLNERRLDYRALAETLRVRIYWAISGLSHSVADSYLSQMKGEIAWVRMALKTLTLPKSYWPEAFHALPSEAQLEQLKFARDFWIEEQWGYYLKNSHGRLDGVIKLNRLAALLTLAGFTASLLAVYLPSLNTTLDSGPGFWVSVAANLLLVGGVLAVSYSERRSHSELASQYERMLRVFDQGMAEVTHVFNGLDKIKEEAKESDEIDLAINEAIVKVQEILKALGEEAISEHSQWLILRRNRPIEAMLH